MLPHLTLPPRANSTITKHIPNKLHFLHRRTKHWSCIISSIVLTHLVRRRGQRKKALMASRAICLIDQKYNRQLPFGVQLLKQILQIRGPYRWSLQAGSNAIVKWRRHWAPLRLAQPWALLSYNRVYSVHDALSPWARLSSVTSRWSLLACVMALRTGDSRR